MLVLDLREARMMKMAKVQAVFYDLPDDDSYLGRKENKKS